MKNWLKKYRWHFVSWAVFILYEYLLVAVVLGLRTSLLNNVLHYAFNIALFYLHADFTLPFSLKKTRERYLLLAVLLLIELGVYTILAYYGDLFIVHGKQAGYATLLPLKWKLVFSTLWRGIYFLLFATAFYFFRHYLNQQKRNAELELSAAAEQLKAREMAVELAAARNDYLKAQINPHFLFNTLTFIYNSTHKSEPRSAEAVRYLSKLMRYALECEHGPELMPLGGEIVQVENLLQLCRIKQTEIYVDFSYPEGAETLEVIPLLLLGLAENMVKHGNLSSPDNPGKISLGISGGIFSISTSNLINTGLNDSGFSTGLDNIRQRLSHSYGSRAALTYGALDGRFLVNICIALDGEFH